MFPFVSEQYTVHFFSFQFAMLLSFCLALKHLTISYVIFIYGLMPEELLHKKLFFVRLGVKYKKLQLVKFEVSNWIRVVLKTV